MTDKSAPLGSKPKAENVFPDTETKADESDGEQKEVVEEAATAPQKPAFGLLNADILNDIHMQVCRLAADFDAKLKYDKHKQETIDRLHGELQEHRNDLLFKLLSPLILDVIQTLDDIKKQVVHYKEKDSLDPSRLLKDLEGFAEDLNDVLYRQQVDSYHVDETSFDPSKQKIMGKVPTNDASMAKTIAKRNRPGYMWRGKVIRPEMVTVYKYRQLETQPLDEQELNNAEKE